MNEEIETTPWHLFYTSEGWVEAGELSVGDVIVSLGSVIIVDATQTMYDLTIEEVHTFNDELRMMLEEAGFQIVIRTNSQGIYKLMIYTIIEPPIYIQHRKMSSNEAKYFYDWFIASIPNRLDILSIAIETSDAMDGIVSLNKEFNSLKGLGDWFKRQSQHRLKTDEEKYNQMINLSQKQKAMFSAVDVVLTEKTLSLVTDIGIYCGEVLINEINGAKWELHVPKQTNDVNYQKPVITGIKNSSICNPVQIVLNIASKFAWDAVESIELYERFVHWKN